MLLGRVAVKLSQVATMEPAESARHAGRVLNGEGPFCSVRGASILLHWGSGLSGCLVSWSKGRGAERALTGVVIFCNALRVP